MELYRKQQSEPVWFSFENPTGAKGAGGQENNGAKGHPSDPVAPGERKLLCDMEGPGVVRRIWMTLNEFGMCNCGKDAFPVERVLREVWLEMYWDGEDTPAVRVPLGDFFCLGAGKMAAFESELLASPEGRSLLCLIPMPFRRRAQIFLVNETEHTIPRLYYDVDLTREPVGDDALYFHAIYRFLPQNKLCEDVEILPRTEGCGRFLGTAVTVRPNADYEGRWWGESEIKMYLDGDRSLPSLVGTGAEDYIGTAWEQNVFATRFSGCLCCEKEITSFYRFHVPDPICFSQDCRVVMQTIGGASKADLLRFLSEGKAVCPAGTDIDGHVHPLYRREFSWEEVPDNCSVNFFRCDCYATVAYFYLDRP